MKMILSAIVAVAAIAAGSVGIYSQETGNWTDNVISSGNYKISVGKMMPMGGGVKILTSDYSVKIRNDSLFSYLPYAGEGYSIPYGGGKGLIFDAPLSGYGKEYGKDKITVTAKVRNDEDSFTYTITVFSNGSVNLGVQPVNRRFVSFSGMLESGNAE